LNYITGNRTAILQQGIIIIFGDSSICNHNSVGLKREIHKITNKPAISENSTVRKLCQRGCLGGGGKAPRSVLISQLQHHIVFDF
jgi:hypothetical protein